MDTAIYAALIAFAGAIIGALIQAYADDLKRLFSSNKINNKDLIGKWDCIWNLEQSDDSHPDAVRDVLEIYKSSGSWITGRANTPEIGDWMLNGYFHRAGYLTFTFQGIGRNQLAGSGIVKLNIERNIFEGLWSQVDPQGIIVSGTTTWKKMKDS
ncbi:hypothetical protein ACLG6S_09130 [Thermodesulfobacteriota bacterium B35]